jgi:hypothetical protein
MGGGEGKMAGEDGLTGGVHLPVSQKNKDIGRLVERTNSNETIIVFLLNCAM